MKSYHVSIKWKLLLYLLLFVIAILFVLWFSQTVFLNDFYQMMKTDHIKSTADYLTEEMDSEQLQNTIDNASTVDDLCIHIVDANGATICYTERFGGCIVHRFSPADLHRIYLEASRAGGSLFRHFELSQPRLGKNPPPQRAPMQSIVYAKLTTTASDEPRMILIGSTITPVDTTVKTLQVQLGYFSILFIIAAGLLAFVLAKKIAKPMIEINDSSKALAKGVDSVSFDAKGYLEVEQLRDTLNQAAREIAKTEKLQQELLANISHDLRTPLTMITGYSEALRDLPDENTPENIQVIIDEANRLTRLVNDVLCLSRLQSGTQALQISHFDLTQAVADTIARCARLTERERYQIDFQYDRHVFVDADELQLSQVIYNLIGNALTYTGDDRRVTIVQSVNEHTVRISVTDTGDGIPHEQLEHIWERYYKAGPAHTHASQSTGLGLAIVQSIIRMHDGRCGVESTPNGGSTFWFELDF